MKETNVLRQDVRTNGASSNSYKINKHVVNIKGLEIGDGAKPVIIAGPCSIESEQQIMDIAHRVKMVGANMLRGGAYKPRTRPESFQGLGEQGLIYLKQASIETGLPIISEITSEEHIGTMLKYVDVLQIGSRNMQNYELLKKIGKYASTTPVLLKRGMSATKEELIGAIDYLVHSGHNDDILICERGIRTSVNEGYSRNILDLNIVADLKLSTKYPVIVDPSHAAGRADIIEDLSRASIAIGANGLIIETHINPELAVSDAKQHITPVQLEYIVKDTNKIYKTLYKK